MRYLGAALTAAACFLLGQYWAGRIQARVKALEAVQLMLCVLQTQLRFSAAPVEELLRLLCEREGLRQLAFLGECRKACLAGTPFPVAWQEALAGGTADTLGRDGRAQLLSFGEDLGTTDLEGQLQRCELYAQLLGESLAAARETQKKYAKLLPGVGLLCGLAFAILLL